MSRFLFCFKTWMQTFGRRWSLATDGRTAALRPAPWRMGRISLGSTNTTHYTARRSPTFRTKPFTFRSYTSTKTPQWYATPFKGWFLRFLNQTMAVGKWCAVRKFGNVKRIRFVSTRANVPPTKETADLRLLLFLKCNNLTGVYVVSTYEKHPIDLVDVARCGVSRL